MLLSDFYLLRDVSKQITIEFLSCVVLYIQRFKDPFFMPEQKKTFT